MWDFLNNLLESAGFVAVIYAVTMGAMGLTIRALWKKIGEKERERSDAAAKLEKAQAEKDAAVEKVRREEFEKRSRMREAFDEQLLQLADERRAEIAGFTVQIAELQERRVQDAQTMVREAVAHIAETRASVKEITHAMTTLERVLRA